MVRTLLCAAALTTLLLGAVPARADDDLTRRLIDQCVGCTFPKDLRGRDLHDLRFVGSDLRDVDFSNAKLSGARFVGADLAGARFDGADLRNARFEGVRFRRTSFARAKIDGVRMTGVDLSGTAIVGTDPHAFDVRGRGWARMGDRDGAELGAIPPLPVLPPIPDVGPQVERALREAERSMRRLQIEGGPCTRVWIRGVPPIPPRRAAPPAPPAPSTVPSPPAMPAPGSSRAS
ncbi:hypothetical protein WPS_13640 [Vulcanimicrobium alpinum]|uniref:Pentapeptide repeat-containing protein n=1 Tax=Vulcanimicrobium alpinum TaxID=3016050 RepID=A0AAN2C9K6_UNVUL|nr:pentapeptide repeat-containing protein [Vulcanimicrobium alpinum]BDE06088.1 hypothetical protein WPS_13640 [Vulcanimicrobium alpinum]